MAVQTSEAIEGAPADQRRPAVRGHALALVTVVVWAVTFVSTKVLLVHLAPIEILFFRFVIGFVALALLRPRILHVRGFKEERWFMLAGATGVTVYYLLENIALTFTTASIVGVVVASRAARRAALSQKAGWGRRGSSAWRWPWRRRARGPCTPS